MAEGQPAGPRRDNAVRQHADSKQQPLRAGRPRLGAAFMPLLLLLFFFFFFFLGSDFVTRAGPCNSRRTHVGPVRGCSNPAKSTPCDFRATYRLHTTTTDQPHTCGPSTTARPYGRHLAVQPLQATRTQPCTHYKPLHTMNLCRHTAKATQGHTHSNTAGRAAAR